MNNRLVAYGRIQKGPRCRYLVVVLDDRLWEDGSRWRRALRFFSRPADNRLAAGLRN
ncbi:MAG: hypothetical protein JXQ83_02865 [Candidatus Glassbacteria bacterium]|nr:hypothetical protein [Candidatus Glassbacteria bacterium]